MVQAIVMDKGDHAKEGVRRISSASGQASVRRIRIGVVTQQVCQETSERHLVRLSRCVAAGALGMGTFDVMNFHRYVLRRCRRRKLAFLGHVPAAASLYQVVREIFAGRRRQENFGWTGRRV